MMYNFTIFLVIDLPDEDIKVSTHIFAQLTRELITIDDSVIIWFWKWDICCCVFIKYFEVFSIMIKPTFLAVTNPWEILFLLFIAFHEDRVLSALLPVKQIVHFNLIFKEKLLQDLILTIYSFIFTI